jgi:hypothetical protein
VGALMGLLTGALVGEALVGAFTGARVGDLAGSVLTGATTGLFVGALMGLLTGAFVGEAHSPHFHPSCDLSWDSIIQRDLHAIPSLCILTPLKNNNRQASFVGHCASLLDVVTECTVSSRVTEKPSLEPKAMVKNNFTMKVE